MPSDQRLVLPKLPTVLAGRTSVDMPGYDLFWHTVESVHVVPTILDVFRFEEALSRVLQLYPHAAGQLRCEDGRWFIELTNTGVPVVINYKPDTTLDTLLNGDWVIQDDLSPFLDRQSLSPRSANGCDPLLRIQLTFLDNETCIGVSWYHVLGDATLGWCLSHTLSQFYQDLPQEYPSPTFEKYHFPKPSPAILAKFLPSIPHLHTISSLGNFEGVRSGFYSNFEDVKWRIDNDDLVELRSVLSSRTHTRFSQQDCLIAYVIAVLNHNTSTAVKMITSVSSFRDIDAPFIAKNGAGNQMQIVSAPIPTDMAGIATALRQTLAQCRKPDHIHDVMSVTSDLMLEAANAGRGFDLIYRNAEIVVVNSFVAVDFCTAHYGFLEGARFYRGGMGQQVLRCCRSNPVKGGDGVWRPRRSIDFSLGVTAELKPKLLETFARGIQHMLKNERARL